MDILNVDADDGVLHRALSTPPPPTTELVELRLGEWDHVKKALYAYRTHRLKYTSSAAYREYCAVRSWTLHCKEGVVSPY